MSSYSKLAHLHAEHDLDLEEGLNATLGKISQLREQQLEKKPKGGQHVIFYASGFLQKHGETIISDEDINGFMNALYRVKSKSLTLILHTPGGDLAAVETIVEYLHSKFDYLEVIVPAYAMSAGAMISLASDHIIMGKAGQLGPVDPQIVMEDGRRSTSTQTVIDAFELADFQIRENPRMENAWRDLLQSVGCLNLLDAMKGLAWSKEQVKEWLASKRRHLLADKKKAADIVTYFVAEPSKKHGEVHTHDQRIGLGKLRQMGLNVKALEDSQELQDEVMTAYWLATLIFEQIPGVSKVIASNKNPPWFKEIPMDVVEVDEEEDSEE